MKSSVSAFDVTNRRNNFFIFLSSHGVVIYLYNTLAKSYALFQRYCWVLTIWFKSVCFSRKHIYLFKIHLFSFYNSKQNVSIFSNKVGEKFSLKTSSATREFHSNFLYRLKNLTRQFISPMIYAAHKIYIYCDLHNSWIMSKSPQTNPNQSKSL